MSKELKKLLQRGDVKDLWRSYVGGRPESLLADPCLYVLVDPMELESLICGAAAANTNETKYYFALRSAHLLILDGQISRAKRLLKKLTGFDKKYLEDNREYLVLEGCLKK